jgi:uncharacterized cofD-like protein
MPVVLRGLKPLLFAGGRVDDPERLTAVVAVTDDGGSSGRLRDEFGILPPGDLRNCLVALSHNEPLMARLFQARYRTGQTLEGHSVGNLIIAALAQEGGCFLGALRLVGEVLNIQGRVLPVALEPARLVARLSDGREVAGEAAITAAGGAIGELRLDPAGLAAAPGVTAAIEQADLVVLGPGSLFTSLVPGLLVPEVAAALRSTAALRVLVLNAMTERGETDGLGGADYVRTLREYAGGDVVDAVLVADDPIPDALRQRYAAEGAVPLDPHDPALALAAPLVERGLLLELAKKVRHDPDRTARALVGLWRRSRRREATCACEGSP